jgi:PAS domain S-box-containing protein
MKYFIKISLIIFGAIFLLAGNLSHIFFPGTYWFHTDLHSSLEVIGAVCALLLASLILQIRINHQLSFFYIWITCGLTGMGMLDLFHSLVAPGEAFVWLHSIAIFTGGLFFAMVWVPEQKIPARYLSLLPRAALITTLLLGFLSIGLPDYMPAMLLEGGGFTQSALLINLSGGLLFIAAAVWFIKNYIRDRAFDSLLFSINSYLFGVAGILFYFSGLWDAGWWHLHAVRIAAYLVSIYYAFGVYKKLTDQLQDQKEKAQRYLDVAASILAVLDVHENVVLINRRGCMLLGRREEEITGRNWFDTVLPERSRNDARFFFRKLISDTVNQYTHSETPVLTRKGDERLIAWHNTLLKDDEGRIKSVLISGEDVTDRKKAEEELLQAHQLLETRIRERTTELEEKNILLKEEIHERRTAEEKLKLAGAYNRSLIEASLDPLVTISADGKITDVNAATEKVTGYSREELIGSDFSEYFIEPEKAREGYQKAFREGTVYDYELEISNRNGHTTPVLYNASVYSNEAGEIIGVFAAARNIAERKKMEDRIRSSLQEKEVLLQEIHHRVKNNMTVISSLLKLQADKVTDEYYRELFNESTNRIKTMALIHEKLYRSDDLARIVFSDYLKDMMDNIVGSYGVNARKVHFKKELEMITLPLDTSIPCGLIVNELLSNSLKYAFPDRKSGEIIVSLRKNNGKIELTVGDDGIGLPADLDFRNTGSLGLNIVNALVRQIRGDIELHREQGTEFIITFRSDN